jgi:integration host factor subunit beta
MEQPMNKSDLIETLAARADTTRKQAERVVNLIFDSMSGALVNGDRIEIRGFGTFVSKHYPAYEGRNPRTGAVIRVAEKHLPFFKVGKDLRERVDEASTKGENSNPEQVAARRGE